MCHCGSAPVLWSQELLPPSLGHTIRKALQLLSVEWGDTISPALNFFIHLLCDNVSVHVCVYVWRPDMDVEHHPKPFPPSVLETGSLTDPGAADLARLVGQQSQIPSPGIIKTRYICFFHMCHMLGIGTQVHMHTWQVIYQLSHLPTPQFILILTTFCSWASLGLQLLMIWNK